MNNMEYSELSIKSKDEIIKLFKTREEGLSKKEVEERLEEYGENIATNKKKKTPLYFILEQNILLNQNQAVFYYF